ncbi:MAG TPA: hypothetical protein VGG72_30345 [Bryobacteraceae bacterium]|jgi:hypothetical protein
MLKKYIEGRRHKGSFVIEFTIVSWVLIVMLVGSFQMGMMLIRAIQAGGLCRNGNVLMIRGIDLSQSINQQLLLRTAPSLGINTPGAWTPSATGAGLVVLSQVYYVGPLECSNGVADFDGTTGTCPNLGQYVIAMRLNIGNTAQGTSVVGNPGSTPGSNGFLTANQICTVSSNIAAASFSSIITLTSDQYTWVSEVFANSTAYNIFSIMPSPTIYMRNLS